MSGRRRHPVARRSARAAEWTEVAGSMLERHGLPGEGCIDLVAVMDLAAGAGHDGSVQIEVLFRLWADAGTSAAEDALVRSVGRLRAAAG